MPIPLQESSPAAKNGLVYIGSPTQFDNYFTKETALPAIKHALENHSWGYHIAPFDRLDGILKEGWQPLKNNINGKKGSTQLHLSTHLRVNYDIIDDVPQVILRTPLNPTNYKIGIRENSLDNDLLFHGHIYRGTGISKEQVKNQMEFSVDNGVTWYPLTKEFVDIAKSGLLPNYRTILIP